jgi:hypothetical protein
MPLPGIITGGPKGNIFARYSKSASAPGNPKVRGVFASTPGSTAKYAVNRGARDAEYAESMARLFVEIPQGKELEFLNSVSPEARPLATILMSGKGYGGSGGTGFVDFLLTSTAETFQEKAQIVDTLTDNYAAFYSGQEPPLFQYQGTLLNTYQDDQRVWMLTLYREILRGTRLAARNLLVHLRYDSFIVSGYMESLSLGLNGETEHTASQFAFTLRVKRMRIITPALGGLKQVSTPVSTETLVENNASATSALPPRNGSTTADIPPTAVTGPAANAGDRVDKQKTAETIKKLVAQGKTAAEALAAVVAAAAVTVTPETDSRELELVAKDEGVTRVADAGKTGTASSPTNDGNAGATNVKGSVRSKAQAHFASLDEAIASLPPGVHHSLVAIKQTTYRGGRAVTETTVQEY